MMKKVLSILLIIGLTRLGLVSEVLGATLSPGLGSQAIKKIILASPTAVPTPTATGTFKLPGKLKFDLSKMLEKGVILSGKVTAKSGTDLTVEKEGVSYKVNITGSTKFRRRFWGVSQFSEISVGDMVDVYGSWINSAKTEMNARFVRDLSIQMRFGVFFGEVKTVSGDVIVMTSVHRGDQMVAVGAGAKLVNRKMEDIKITDILVGHKIRVKGLWNNNANTVTDVKQIKDFSTPSL